MRRFGRKFWLHGLCAAGLLLLLAACGAEAPQDTPAPTSTPDSAAVIPVTDDFSSAGATMLTDEEREANARAAVLAHSGVPEEDVVSMRVIIDDSL